MARVFLSYSHKDEGFRDQLETHLAMLKRQGFVEIWHDRRIVAGERIDEAISANLETADIVLLLVSPDFLASDYCYERETMRAIERHEAGLATVIPIIVRPCDWKDAPFGNLLAAPKDGKPITQWANVDEAFLDVTTAIKGALRQRDPASATAKAAPDRGTSVRATAGGSPDIRSSNLRVAKRFSDRDKDRFLHEAFEYMAKFFENSLTELSKRNADIDGQFRRNDANRFTAVAYRDGEAVARCSIFLGDRSGFTDGIAYSHDTSSGTTAFNENLSVESDDQALYLRPLGMGHFGRGEAAGKLSLEGGAELYWETFIEPLQRS
jgi:TIR domain-containing protein